MFGSRLRKMRLSRDMTQKQLAGDRYTHAYVSSIEAGRRMPSRDALEHFASQLGVDVDELLT
ncbi:MAG: helix-turn-helix domain-containing protein [Actinomycetota bacterium]